MIKIYNYAIIFWFAGMFCGHTTGTDKAPQVWSWQYHKQIDVDDQIEGKNKNAVIFSQKKVPSFSQLILSWNALRPPVGHFTFYVSAQDAHTNNWGSWHQVAKWGADVQRSFRAKHDSNTRHEYVRFEVGGGAANGFRVKVVGDNNADIGLLKALHVNISDFSKFTDEIAYSLHALNSVQVKNVPSLSQKALDHPRNTDLCSPTACSMVVSYLTKQPINPIDFARGAFDHGLDIYGSWPFNMAHAFECSQGKALCAISRLNSFKDIHRQLCNGLPVVVSVRGDLPGAPKTYNNGHLLVVVGWDADKKVVICHDPAFETNEETVVHYPIDSFIGAWERSRRLSYLMKPHSF